MNFNSKNDVIEYTRHLKEIGFGSRGTCYLQKSSQSILKIFHDFECDDEDYESEFTSEEILRFRHIESSTFKWAKDIILLNGTVIGYVTTYVNARNLYKINPLTINLDTFIRSIVKAHDDIKSVSKKGVVTYDVMYNILYNGVFSIIDHDEYSYSNKNPELIEKNNMHNFDFEIYYFLIDAYFDRVVNDNKDLKELYSSKNEDVLLFIRLLKKHLSELVGNEIHTLKQASKYIERPKYGHKYQRT